MHQDLTVSSYISVRAGCPIRVRVISSDNVEVAFGGQRPDFELEFKVDALRELIKLGTETLDQIDARRAHGAAGR